MGNRIEYIDAAKRVTILLVILGHVNWMYSVATTFFYAFHIPLFFIISGCFIKELSFKEAFCKYGKLYLKPYLISCLIMLGCSLLRVALYGGSYGETAFQVVERAFFGSGWSEGRGLWATIPHIGVLWFLWGIFWACVLYAVLKKHFNLTERFVWVLFLFGFSCITVDVVRLPFSLQAGMSATLFFYIGDLLHHHQLMDRVKGLSKLTQGVAIVGALLCAFFTGRVTSSICYYPMAIAQVPAAIVLCLLLFYLLEKGQWKGGWIGRSTLYILCAHALSWDVLGLFDFHYGLLQGSRFFKMLMESSAQIAIALALGYVMQKLSLFGKK